VQIIQISSNRNHQKLSTQTNATRPRTFRNNAYESNESTCLSMRSHLARTSFE